MAERRTGRGKPPIIDLTARDTGIAPVADDAIVGVDGTVVNDETRTESAVTPTESVGADFPDASDVTSPVDADQIETFPPTNLDPEREPAAPEQPYELDPMSESKPASASTYDSVNDPAVPEPVSEPDPILEPTPAFSSEPETTNPFTSPEPETFSSTTSPERETTPPPFTPKSPPTDARPGKRPSVLLPILGGGVLGLAAAYGLASAGYWPSTATAPTQTAAQADPRLDDFARQLPELAIVTQTSQSELAALSQRVSGLESAEPTATTEPTPATEPVQPTPAVDLAPLQSQLAALTSRLDALPEPAAATPQVSPDEVTALRLQVEQLQTQLQTQLASVDQRINTAETSLTGLSTQVEQTTTALAAQPTNIGSMLQLPLVLSGLETAFATGRPFQGELNALRANASDIQIPPALANVSATGLPRADTIAARFEAAYPAILAGRPVGTAASWQDNTLDWFRSVLVLRPSGELEGDTPEAIASRLQAAIARRDFAAAQTLFTQLPPTMLAAAETLPADVAAQAEAAAFLVDLRQRALTQTEGASR